MLSSGNQLCVSAQGTSVARGGADLDMAEELVKEDDQAQAVHPHIVVEVTIAFFHLRSDTCLVDLMQTWHSMCNACLYHAQGMMPARSICTEEIQVPYISHCLKHKPLHGVVG